MKVLKIVENENNWEIEIMFPDLKKGKGKERVSIIQTVEFAKIKDVENLPAAKMLGLQKSFGNFSVSGFSYIMKKTKALMQEHSPAFGRVYGTASSKIRRDWIPGKFDEAVVNENGDEITYLIDGKWQFKADPILSAELKRLENKEFKDLEDEDRIKSLRKEIKAKRGEKFPLERYFDKEYVLTLKGWIPKLILEFYSAAGKEEKEEDQQKFKEMFLEAFKQAKDQEEQSEVIKLFSIELSNRKEKLPEYEIVKPKAAEGKTLNYSARTFTPKSYQEQRGKNGEENRSWRDIVVKKFLANKLDSFQVEMGIKLGFLERVQI